MKVYLVTVDDETADIIDRAEANCENVFIGDFVEKNPTIDIKLYVDVNDD
jgi:hypothetical protein